MYIYISVKYIWRYTIREPTSMGEGVVFLSYSDVHAHIYIYIHAYLTHA